MNATNDSTREVVAARVAAAKAAHYCGRAPVQRPPVDGAADVGARVGRAVGGAIVAAAVVLLLWGLLVVMGVAQGG